MRDIEKLTSGLVSQGIHVVLDAAPSRSHFGGLPEIPADIAWPEWKGRKLAFVARFSLGDLHQAHRVGWLPETGALLFFYDMEEQPWGYKPEHRGSCAVLHVPDVEVPGRATDVKSAGSFITRKDVLFRPIETRPQYDSDAVFELGLTDEEHEQYLRLQELPYQHRPKHQLAGAPVPLQEVRMELECQLASNGLYCGDGSGYEDPRAAALEAGASEWRLLLQIDSDEELFPIADAGAMLFFWVRECDAASGRFENPWLIFQWS